MEMTISLLLLTALLLFWLNSLSALEAAHKYGKKVCNEINVQFLDDTVASTSISLARDPRGRRVLRRTYRFEFSETGNNRREGKLIMLGDNVESMSMEPYQIEDKSAFIEG
jgi:hypothetical protein